MAAAASGTRTTVILYSAGPATHELWDMTGNFIASGTLSRTAFSRVQQSVLREHRALANPAP